jgi:hypothetical protein
MDVGRFLRKLFGEPARGANNFLFGPNKLHTTSYVFIVLFLSIIWQTQFMPIRPSTIYASQTEQNFIYQRTKSRPNLLDHLLLKILEIFIHSFNHLIGENASDLRNKGKEGCPCE